MAGRKKRLASTQEWEARRRATRSTEWRARPPEGGCEEGGRKAYRVAENPRRDHQGVHKGVESPPGIDTPGVDEFPRGDKTPGVATEGEGITGEDGRGRGGGGNPPATRETEERRTGGGDEAMTRGPGMAAPPRPQRGMAEDDNIARPSRGNLTVSTVPVPKTARIHAASTAYWRQRSWGGVQPTRELG